MSKLEKILKKTEIKTSASKVIDYLQQQLQEKKLQAFSFAQSPIIVKEDEIGKLTLIVKYTDCGFNSLISPVLYSGHDYVLQINDSKRSYLLNWSNFALGNLRLARFAKEKLGEVQCFPKSLEWGNKTQQYRAHMSTVIKLPEDYADAVLQVWGEVVRVSTRYMSGTSPYYFASIEGTKESRAEKDKLFKRILAFGHNINY